MVQNTPVIRSFAGNHTDLVSPWVMLDEFGPMRVEPGTLGMDINHTDSSPWVMLDEFGPMRVEPGTLGMDIKA